MPSTDIPERFTTGWLDGLDSRRSLTRELRDRYRALTDDLGGADCLSYAQRSLAERALWLERFLVQQEQVLAEGGEFDSGKWVQACNSLQGIYSRLGLERKAKEVPSLGEYLAKREGAKQ